MGGEAQWLDGFGRGFCKFPKLVIRSIFEWEIPLQFHCNGLLFLAYAFQQSMVPSTFAEVQEVSNHCRPIQLRY